MNLNSWSSYIRKGRHSKCVRVTVQLCREFNINVKISMNGQWLRMHSHWFPFQLWKHQEHKDRKKLNDEQVQMLIICISSVSSNIDVL